MTRKSALVRKEPAVQVEGEGPSASNQEGASAPSLFDGKVCVKCGEWKTFSEFKPHRTRRDGFGSSCRRCVADGHRRWRAAKRESDADAPKNPPALLDDGSKRCTDCGEVKPLSCFSAGTTGVSGKSCYCKPCANVRQKFWKARQVMDLTKVIPEEKLCPGCGLVRPRHDFTIDRGRKSGLKPYCRACCKERSRKINDSDKARAKSRERRRLAIKNDPEKAYAPQRKRRANKHVRHAEAISKAEREGRRPNFTTAESLKKAIRRTKSVEAVPITLAEWASLKAKYDHRCLCCGKQEPDIRLTLDHIVPVSKGGDSSLANIQPLCRSCNCRKHDLVMDYRPSHEA